MIDNKTFEFLSNYLRLPSNRKEDTFLNSALYYALTGRKGTKIYQNSDSMLIVCNHPSQENSLLVFPEIGNNTGVLTRTFLNHVNLGLYNVSLARYSLDDMATLTEILKKHPTDRPISINTKQENNMDWLYPIHILSTIDVSKMDGPNFRNIRQKFRQALKSPLSLHNIHNCNGIEYAKAAHKYWQGNQILINTTRNKDNIDDFYDTLFAIIKNYPMHFDGFVHFYEKRPIGFTIWDKPINSTVNLIANIGDTNIKGLSEYQIVSACDYLVQKGISYMNRGGSERFSLNSFKEKFYPEKTLQRISVHVTPEKESILKIRSYDLVHSLESTYTSL